jgi:hypothetical protein
MNENIYINGYCKVDRNISHHKINRAFLLPPGEGQDEGI